MRLGSLGAPELILIVLAIVLIFGASKVGDIGGAIGKSVREFRKESKNGDGGEEETTTVVKSEEPVSVVVQQPEKPVAAGLSDYRPPDNSKPTS